MPLFNNNNAPGFGAGGPMSVPQMSTVQQMPHAMPTAGPSQIPTNKSVGNVPNIQVALSMPMAPNTDLILFDDNADVFYRKRSDISGRIYPLEIYDYSMRKDGNTQQELKSTTVSYPEYATKDDVRQIVKEELENFRSKQWKPKNLKEEKNV